MASYSSFPTQHYNIKLVSSTNDLLLIASEFNGIRSLCVCNPATKDMVILPAGKKYFHSEMGLANDPCELPDRFTIVHPMLYNLHGDGLMYQFDVFRSNTDKWTLSSQSICIDTIYAAARLVCAKGVIYWRCGEYLLWYDTKRDLAGSLTLLIIAIGGVNHIDVYANDIMCSRAWDGGIEVWRLTGGSRWNRQHAASWDSMLDVFDFCHCMRLRRKSGSEMFFRRHIICPVGFDGKFVYIMVKLMRGDNTSRLFRWETTTGSTS